MRTIGSSSNPYLNQMRIRAARRKSRWNLLLLAFAVVGVAASWILIFYFLRNTGHLWRYRVHSSAAAPVSGTS